MIVFLVNLFLIIILVRAQLYFKNPIASSITYAALGFAVGLLAVLGEQESFLVLLGLTLGRLALGTLYFGLLAKFQDGIGWWLIAPLGGLVAIV